MTLLVTSCFNFLFPMLSSSPLCLVSCVDLNVRPSSLSLIPCFSFCEGVAGGWKILQKSTCLIYLLFWRGFNYSILKMFHYWDCKPPAALLGRGSLSLLTNASPHSVLLLCPILWVSLEGASQHSVCFDGFFKILSWKASVSTLKPTQMSFLNNRYFRLKKNYATYPVGRNISDQLLFK